VVLLFIAADNLFWRVAGLIGSNTFVRVTGDIRADLFRHVTGHAPGYFAKRMPGMLTSRVTATSNAVFTIENMFVWNVAPPCLATIGAIGFLAIVNGWMAGLLAVVSCGMIVVIFHIAAAGKPLHHDFADKAAAVDGEMVDVIGNISLVKAFGGLSREQRRFDATVAQELRARRRSLLYLERLRLTHAVVTVFLIVGLLAWAIHLWQRREATVGDVVLVCTLGISVLSATRDFSVALVDVTQHFARLSEALHTPYFVNYHLEHHLLFYVPCYNLPKLHDILMRRPHAARMEVRRGYLSVLRLATAKPNVEDRPGNIVDNARRKSAGNRVSQDQASSGF